MTTPRRILVPLLLGLLALPGAATAAEGGIPRFLLIWQDAPLYTLPTVEAPRVQIFDWPATAREEHPGRVMWVELVGESGEFYEVITRDTIYADGQCYGPVPDMWAYEVHLFVHRQDVALATTEAVEVSFRDGTGATLKPGVALLPLTTMSRKPQYLVAADGLHFVTHIRETAVGTAFRPDPRPHERTSLTFTLAEGAAMRMGAGIPVERYRSWGMRRPTTRDEHRQGALITLVGECGQYRVTVREEDLSLTGPGGGVAGLLGTGGGGAGVGEVQVAAVDTPVYFPDGRRAGQVSYEQVFYPDDLLAFEGGDRSLRCTTVLLGGGFEHLRPMEERSLQLCFDPAELALEEREGWGSIENLFEGDGDLDAVFRDVDGIEVGKEGQ